MLSARDRADDQQQDHGAADRDQPGAEIEEVVDVADVEGARDEAADQGAEDADGGGAEAATGLGAAGDQGACDQASEESQKDPGDDSLPGRDPTGPDGRAGVRRLGVLTRRGVVAQVPEDVPGGAEAAPDRREESPHGRNPMNLGGFDPPHYSPIFRHRGWISAQLADSTSQARG